MMSQNQPPCSQTGDGIVAAHLDHEIVLNAAQSAPEWKNTDPIVFCSDWQGKNADPGRQTEVRLLWSSETLYLRFESRYRELFLFEDSDPDGRRDRLWERDVAEAFLQPDPWRGHSYYEMEVSPNGMWIDLDIFPGGRSEPKSGLKRSVFLDEKARMWVAEVSVPIQAVTAKFDPAAMWRANFYRIEGQQEPRTYMAWQPTRSAQPDFHVPEAFGKLRFGPREK